MVEIKQQLVPMANRKATYGTGNPRKKMVVHQTGNPKKGANAKMHANLQERGYSASWHIQSDDTEIIQSWPFTYRLWHASTSDRTDGGNMVGIGWEICINSDGNYLKSLELASKGIAKVMKQEGIPMSGLTTHNAEDRVSRKWCPSQILSGKDGINWTKFVQMVQSELDILNHVPVVLGTKTHKVQVGDTLWAIGRKYKVSVEDIKKWNKLTSALIFPGQVLSVTGEVKKEQPQPKPQPKPKKEYVRLSAKVSSWRIYPLGVQPVANNEKGFLNPKQFNGLEYEVLGYEDNKKCAIIQTQDFGKGKIYLDSDATIVWK